MGIPSDGSYGIPEGVIFGYPVVCSGGRFEIVQGLGLSDFSKAKIAGTHAELLQERADIAPLLA
jgi:malate/lactate dehydrogenase